MYTADNLRSDIRRAELLVANIRPGTPADKLLEFYYLLDGIAEGLAQLERTGIDLRAESSRIETVHRILQDKDRIVVRILASHSSASGHGYPASGRPQIARGLAAFRDEIDPPRDRFWWYLDQRVAERKVRHLKRFAIGAVVGALLLAILAVLYVRFLRPDEATRQRLEYVFSAESSIQAGQYTAALQAYTSALEIAPDDPEINMMVGVMYEAIGQPEKADAPYRRATELYGSRAIFLAMRAQQYGTLGWYDRAETDALEAIELDDQFALAYCSLGSAYEGQANVPQAVAAFQACADRAREQEQNELYVIATTRLAYLMQRP